MSNEHNWPGMLEKILRGAIEALPPAYTDEPVEDAVMRYYRVICWESRDAVRAANSELLAKYLRDGDSSDDYAVALVRLAKMLELPTLAENLHTLADLPRFASFPPAQQRVILSTLLDLRVALPAEFWTRMAQLSPQRFGVVSLSALLRLSLSEAAGVLRLLPDDIGVADELYVTLTQEAGDDVQRLIAKLAPVEVRCRPAIVDALVDALANRGGEDLREVKYTDVCGGGATDAGQTMYLRVSPTSDANYTRSSLRDPKRDASRRAAKELARRERTR